MSKEAQDCAQRELESIVELMERYEKAGDDDDALLREIWDTPLEVGFRATGWTSFDRTYANGLEPDEYRIVLVTGGPAVQITGDYEAGRGVVNARIQHQNWFEPWADLDGSKDNDALYQFATLIVGDAA